MLPSLVACRVASRRLICKLPSSSFRSVAIKSPQLPSWPALCVRGLSTNKATEPSAEAKETQANETTEATEAPKEAATQEKEADEKDAEPEPTLEEQLQMRIEELEASAADFENRWKRALADSENTRTQAKREIANSKKFAVQGFAKSMLDVCDNLQLALEHTPDDQRSPDVNPALSALFEGVEMTEKTLMNSLEKHGVTRFYPIDQAFDPNIMMALYEMPAPDKEPGTVAAVVKTGFMLNDRVLRPADVGVVKKP